MTTDLTLAAALDRSLAWCGGGSVRFLLATVAAEAREAAPRPARNPLNLALVIDASGSMAGGKLDAAIAAAQGVVDRLGPSDRLSVVSFATDVITHLDGAAMTPAAQAGARAAIAALTTRGCTNLSGGWFAGVEAAARVAETGRGLAPRVVILSDGHANQGITDRDALAGHAAELCRRGVTTSTLGIGDGYDEGLLGAIAEHGGGRMHDAEHAADIGAVLLGEIGEAGGTLAEGVALALDLPPGAEAEVLGQAAVRREGGRLTVQLGALAPGRPRQVAMRLTLPAGEPGARLSLRLSATGRAAADGAALAPAAAEAAATLARGAENEAQPRDETAAAAIAAHWHAHIRRELAAMNRDGAGRAARDYLDGQRAYFEPYVRGLPEAARWLEELDLLRTHAERRWSPRMRKELNFDGYAMLSLRPDFVQHRRAWTDRLREEMGDGGDGGATGPTPRPARPGKPGPGQDRG